MKRLLLIPALLIANYSFADQLDGLAIFDFLIYVILFGGGSLLALIVSALFRFTQKEYKVSIALNFSASVLSFCALIAIGNLDSAIDPGFLAFCIGSITLSVLLMILNYRVGIKRIREAK
jgi:peptidoglycan/LPS O-acetylase OafA/YrhL